MLVDHSPSLPAHAPMSVPRASRSAPNTRDRLTALSGARAAQAANHGRFAAAITLARRSLVTLALAALAPGCLITQEPVSYEPAQTPPIIVASALSPDPRDILLVGGDVGLAEFDITASVLSEDAGESVKVALYVDYGMTNLLHQPFRYALPNFPELPPASLSDGPRKLVGVRWVSDAFPLEQGCHRLTLVVTHDFDTASGCPRDLNDSSQVTFHFRQCGDAECLPMLEGCPEPEATCPLDPTTSSLTDAGTTGG